LYRITKFEHIS